jgi:hypothetical protein
MLDKLKKVGNQISEKTGRGMEYAKGKTQGFKHPEPVEAYIQVRSFAFAPTVCFASSNVLVQLPISVRKFIGTTLEPWPDPQAL